MDTQKQVWDQLWSKEVSYEWDSLSELIYRTLCTYIGSPEGRKIVEAGSGTGKISMHLSKHGADVTLVDYSENAINNSRLAFQKQNCSGSFVVNDIRKMDISDDGYDLTWNAGVVEHFTFEEKVTILKEMLRVTTPGGAVIILTPYAKCLPYRIGKDFAEKQGTWMYGHEEPVVTLEEEFKASGIHFLEERNIGFINSLDFLDFLPGTSIIKETIKTWYEGLTAEEQGHFPGYLLVSVGEKRNIEKIVE
ncbi:biotin biosynthesis protein BioC [compost metagenome]